MATETIYQAVYVQGRGELRRELSRCLRTGRSCRKPRRHTEQRTPRYIDPMVMISDRPAEAADRAVPGHWEGETCIMGSHNRSAIGTLVERHTRYVVLLHLPHGHHAEHVRDALLAAVTDLPAHLVRSLTWDQGVEMGRHGEFSVATEIPVFFCDPGRSCRGRAQLPTLQDPQLGDPRRAARGPARTGSLTTNGAAASDQRLAG